MASTKAMILPAMSTDEADNVSFYIISSTFMTFISSMVIDWNLW